MIVTVAMLQHQIEMVRIPVNQPVVVRKTISLQGPEFVKCQFSRHIGKKIRDDIGRILPVDADDPGTGFDECIAGQVLFNVQAVMVTKE